MNVDFKNIEIRVSHNLKEKVRTGTTTASSPAEAITAYSAPAARTTDARGHNKSEPRHYALRRQTDPRQERNRERYEGQGGRDERTNRPRRSGDQEYQGTWRPSNRGERYRNHYGSRRNSHRYADKKEWHPRSNNRDRNDNVEYREDSYQRNDSIQWKDRYQQKNDRNHNDDHRHGDSRGDTYDNTYSQGTRGDSTGHLNF